VISNRSIESHDTPPCVLGARRADHDVRSVERQVIELQVEAIAVSPRGSDDVPVGSNAIMRSQLRAVTAG
jgi:hypothetical protein